MIRILFNYLNSKSKKYFFLTPLPYSLGDSVEQLMSANSICVKEDKKLIIIKIFYLQKILNYKICNEAIYNNLVFHSNLNNHEKFFKFLISIFVNIFFCFKRGLSLFIKKLFKIKLPEHFFFPDIGCHHYYSDNISLNGDFLKPYKIKKNNFDLNKISLKNKDEEKCKKILLNNNIDINKKFVCLHVRDGEFKKDGDRPNRHCRNSDIRNFYKAINYLLSKNYYVFRIGRSSNIKINFIDQKLIDYPFCDFKSDLMDMYLIKNCDFYIGNMSGPLEVAHMFNKKTLLLDGYRIYENYPRNSLSRATFKHIFFKKNHEKITLDDYIKMEYYFHHWRDYDDKIILNESDENKILDDVKKFTSEHNFNHKKTKDIEKKFKIKMYRELYKKYIDSIKKFKQDDIQFIKKSLYWIKSSDGYYYTD